MKIMSIIAGCLLFGGLTVWAGGVDGNVDYLLLTRENLPAPSVVIEGCLNNLDFDAESYESYIKKKKRAAWLPLIHVGGDVQLDRLQHYDYVDNFQTVYKPDGNPNGTVDDGQTFGGYQQTGFDQAYLFDLWAQWDLRNLVYDFDRQTVVVSAMNLENERHFLYAEVSKRYGKLYSLLPDSPGMKMPASKAVRIIESAAVLDAMSGFVISDTLKDALAVVESKPAVVPNGVDVHEVLEEEKEALPTIIQVDDGQDDTVEKAF